MSENTALRLDIAVSAKLNISRTMARDLIEQERVVVDGKISTRSGLKIDENAEIVINSFGKMFVSRGGFKLQKAIDEFNIDLAGLTCIDIGASSGGFTDCMLQSSAKTVYAVDSGTGQLKDEIRENSKVINMENTDIRTLEKGEIGHIDFFSVDVSFISVSKIIDAVYNLLDDGAKGVMLIKPQFESGPGVVNAKGIIKSPKIHCKTLKLVYNYTTVAGFAVLGLCASPIDGGDGNREFLMYISKGAERNVMDIHAFERAAERLCTR